MKRRSLKNQLRQELFRQHDEGRGKSRHKIKQSTGKFAQYGVISSSRSLDAHLSASRAFSEWVKEERPAVKNLADIDDKVIRDYLKHRDADYAAKTVSADLTFLNHIRCGREGVEDVQPFSKKDLDLRANATDTVTNNRGEQNASETRVLFKSHEPVVEFGRGFGLRRSELVPQPRYEAYAATDKSLYEKDGRIHIATFGKGGRYRTVECLAEKEDFIRQNYGDIIQKVEQLPSRDEFKAIRAAAEPIFKSVSRSIPVHIVCRQYYANHKLDEFEQSGRDYHVLPQNETETGITTYTTNGRTMSREAAQFVSDQMGHNRIYELRKYVNLGTAGS